MKQYIDLLKTIQERGTVKQAARKGMPSTTSLFGYQFRHNLADGFPLLTTKKVNFKNIVTELIWFLNGDTNIKFLIDNGCNIWNEDAYNYYFKKLKENTGGNVEPMDFENFVKLIKDAGNLFTLSRWFTNDTYTLGDCGNQYGKLWRDWKGDLEVLTIEDHKTKNVKYESIDQILELIGGLKNNPLSRRHIITAWNPATLDDMALYACHCMVQFNCRPLKDFERKVLLSKLPHWKDADFYMIDEDPSGDIMEVCDEEGVPKYYLDCQMYQRSADAVLGVPYNIASYALLTEILAKVCNMVAGEYIHTFGDVHIYDNHKEAVETQLQREPVELPTLNFDQHFYDHLIKWSICGICNTSQMISSLQIDWFTVDNYNPAKAIKAKLSTGLK